MGCSLCYRGRLYFFKDSISQPSIRIQTQSALPLQPVIAPFRPDFSLTLFPLAKTSARGFPRSINRLAGVKGIIISPMSSGPERSVGGDERFRSVRAKCPPCPLIRLVVFDDRYKNRKLREGGRLADVGPTLLEMMGLAQPEEMTGQSLLF